MPTKVPLEVTLDWSGVIVELQALAQAFTAVAAVLTTAVERLSVEQKGSSDEQDPLCGM